MNVLDFNPLLKKDWGPQLRCVACKSADLILKQRLNPYARRYQCRRCGSHLRYDTRPQNHDVVSVAEYKREIQQGKRTVYRDVGYTRGIVIGK